MPAQALRVLKDMQQRKAFTALLTLSLAEASKLNDKACSSEMQSLDLAMHIAAGTLPQAYTLAQQVGFPLTCPLHPSAILQGSSTCLQTCGKSASSICNNIAILHARLFACKPHFHVLQHCPSYVITSRRTSHVNGDAK